VIDALKIGPGFSRGLERFVEHSVGCVYMSGQ